MSRSTKGRATVLAAVALLLGSLLLLSCQPAQPAATPKPGEKAVATASKPAEKPVKGGALRFSYYADPNSLDPQSVTAQLPVNSIHDLLIQPDRDGNPTKDGLFKDWAIGSDGKSITFKLQQGIKFHDGTDFDAAAAKFQIERMKDPATKSPYTSNYYAVESVDVVDSATVRFNLSRPDPLLVPRMATQGGFAVSPTAAKRLGSDLGRKPVGSGPFQFVEWVPGDHITLKRFDGYWRKDKDGVQLPYLDQVTFQVITDPATGFANLRTGQVNLYMSLYYGFPIEHWSALKADANLTYATQSSAGVVGIVNMNTAKPPFNNKALRQAVALALDREGMASLQGESATAHASLFSPLSFAYDGKSGMYPTRDVAKAKAKMAEAGYPSGGLKVTFLAQNAPAKVKEAEVIKANLAEIGIEATIEPVAQAVWLTRHATLPPAGGDYQITDGAMPIAMPDPGHLFGIFLHSKATRNALGPYSNPKVDELIDKAGSIYDQKERMVLYQQAANLIVDDAPTVAGWVTKVVVAMNKKVRNYAPDVLSTHGLGGAWLAQ